MLVKRFVTVKPEDGTILSPIVFVLHPDDKEPAWKGVLAKMSDIEFFDSRHVLIVYGLKPDNFFVEYTRTASNLPLSPYYFFSNQYPPDLVGEFGSYLTN